MTSTAKPSTFYLLTQVNWVVHRGLDSELARLRITQSQMIALIRLANERKLSSARLARLLDVSAQSVVAVVRALESRGLIKRTAGEKTGRVMAINVTPSGRIAITKLRAVIDGTEERLLAGVSASEREKLRGILIRILTAHRPLALTDWSPMFVVEEEKAD
jgi:DNA-binding MarR family transcriptional regulator